MKTSRIKVTNTFNLETTKNLKPSTTYSIPSTKIANLHRPILREEAMNVKSSLDQSLLEDVRVSDSSLEKWKLNHGIPDKQISGESLDMSGKAFGSLMERIKELCTGYDRQNFRNLGDSDCFCKALPSKGMAKK